jgi:pyruvate formate-lyase/glycerol dehydratase family glycyl radical enzyme
MTMTPRIEQLRRRSLEAVPTLSGERARLVTYFYRSPQSGRAGIPVQRALAFKYLLENKFLCILPGELIVGERGPAPKATPTYPEVCLHSPEDLDLLHSRPKVPYRVDDQTRRLFADEIAPFWSGRSNRERILAHMAPEWQVAYEAGVFTEFQEQRSPGHTAMGDKIYHKGFLDLKAEIRAAMERLDPLDDPLAPDKLEELQAMAICAEALIAFALRHAQALEDLAARESDAGRRFELAKMARICRKVPALKPETFWEALQMYWFVHVGVITELNPWDAFNPGRLDQHLYPFYARGLADGSLTREFAKELLQAFWIKFNNHPAPPKVGVTAKESNTYVDFALINIGGLTRDNRDGVNALSELILEVVEEMRLLQPSAMIQVSKKNPDHFIRRALEIVRTGFGQPSVFNTDAIVQELVRQGKSLEDALQGGASGCVEAGAFGREAYFLTGYFNLPKVLEITLHNGVDPRSGRRIGPATGDVRRFTCFEQLFDAFTAQLNHFVLIKIHGNNLIERINAKHLPVPFLSLLIDDCIAAGRDYNAGGARYNTSYIQGVGLGTVTDALVAIRHQVFDRGAVSMDDLLAALESNFEGHGELQAALVHDTPKYGNDDDAADNLLVAVFEAYYQAVDGRPNTRGGVHRVNLLPTTCHVYFGSVTGALPDGRRAGLPLSEGISPVQGADRQGPTAVLKSAAKIDHLRTGGTLLNQRFLPQVLAGAAGLDCLTHLIRTYFKMDGHHIQFNVVDSQTLKRAQRHPDDYRDLIVRVAGYSDYFVDLTPELQEEIIRRSAHEAV